MFFCPSDGDLSMSVKFIILKSVQTRITSFLLPVSRRFFGGVLFVQGPSSSAEVRGLIIHDIKEVQGVWQQEEQEDKEMRDRKDQRAHKTWR